MSPDEAMKSLLSEPAAFLKYYPLLIHASPAPAIQNAANISPYAMSKAEGGDDDKKPAHLGATRPGVFGYKRQISSFVLSAGAKTPAATKTALVVPMVNYNSNFNNGINLQNDVSAMPHFVVDGSGSGLMVTGMLSGCCFVWTTQGSDLWCTHVKPTGGATESIQLQTALATTGRFAQAPHTPLSTFGRIDYPDKATVVGVRHGGSWQLYCQTGTMAMKTITGGFHLHPGAKRPL